MLDLTELGLVADRTLAALEAVGQRNGYFWPERDGTLSQWHGYTYEIPKEEQVRTELVSNLKSEGRAIEVEWNWYHSQRPQECGEVDIAVFDTLDRLPSHLIEVKRTWRISGWNAKPAEQRAGLEADLARLRDISESVARGFRAHSFGLLGVFVVDLCAPNEPRLDLSSLSVRPRSLSERPAELRFERGAGLPLTLQAHAMWLGL